MNAHLRGRKLTQYQVVGELRAIPVSVPSPASEFRFRLKNTHRIEQLKVNEKFVKAASGGEYIANLPAMSSSKPVPLIKYVAAAKWRPVPLFMDVSVETSDAAEADGDEGPRLRAVVQTNPALKSTLVNVVVSANLPEAFRMREAPIWPDGSSFEAETRKLQWRVCKELIRDKPVTCSAPITPEAAAALRAADGLVPALAGVPFSVSFGCDGVTISGIELEVQLVGGASGDRAPPIAKLMRRFNAGEYRVTAPKTAADAEQRRESRESRD